MEKKSVLIIGGGETGIQASLDFANSGFPVHLVEPSPFLRKNGEIGDHADNVEAHHLHVLKHPLITVWTNTNISNLDGKEGEFEVCLHQHPRYVDLDLCTACGDCIEVCPVTLPGTNRKAIYLDGQPGCMAINKLGESPCTNACPGGVKVQGYIALVAEGRFQEAIDLIRTAIPFPGICGRVCTHPCEINCQRGEMDSPVSIRLLKRFVSDWEHQNQTTGHDHQNRCQDFSETTTDPARVAVVGAGPGGMSAANVLARKGYQVTVFEKLPVIGGMMAIGIPRYRLPREIITREYDQIVRLGVDIRLNTPIGPEGEYSLKDLEKLGYDAICLAVGAQRGKTLGIPGEGLPGVVQGIEVLKKINLSQYFVSGKTDFSYPEILLKGSDTRVAVLGGGNTAMDVARSLVRLGIENVTILYRRTRSEMPAMEDEIKDTEMEGVKIKYLVSPVRILGDEEDGVSGLECIRMELGEIDSSGRRRPMPVPGSEFLLDLDLIILAIGQNPDLGFLNPNLVIETSDDNRIRVTENEYMTTRPGVFAVGDAVTRDKMAVIEAIGMGKHAAQAIHAYISGGISDQIEIDTLEAPIARPTAPETERITIPRTNPSVISLQQRRKSFKEVELGFSPDQAIMEAKRCLACGPCSECQACIPVCKPGAIFHGQKTSSINIQVGAIYYTRDDEPANDDARYSNWKGIKIEDHLPQPGILRVQFDDPLVGSAAVAQLIPFLVQSKSIDSIKEDPKREIKRIFEPNAKYPLIANQPKRIGIFICQCGPGRNGEISSVIDTMAISSIAASWPGVVHTQEVPFSCSREGALAIETAVQNNNLHQIVLAGCSCCSINQVCSSCTYQRLRCKENLGLFNLPARSSEFGVHNPEAKCVLINIREQCAWTHTHDPEAATAKATAMIAGAAAWAMVTPKELNKRKFMNQSALVLGNNRIAEVCAAAIRAFNTESHQIKAVPSEIKRCNGHYIVTENNHTWTASALVLAPNDDKEGQRMLDALSHKETLGQPRITWLELDSYRTGIFKIDPDSDPELSAAAAATRITAWLNSVANEIRSASMVDPARCRTCGTCVEICEFDAPMLVKTQERHSSWIDPVYCRSCGICAAHCPSGAITPGYSTDSQMDAMLSAILTYPT